LTTIQGSIGFVNGAFFCKTQNLYPLKKYRV
jgi:hypothetical protein